MNGLSAANVLKIRDMGQYENSVNRALIIMSLARPDINRDRLAALSIARRDMILLDIHEQTFGAALNGFSECPKCIERLEFEIAVDDIRIRQEQDPIDENSTFELKEGGYELEFRLPNSHDLSAVTDCADVMEAKDLLMQRCILKASRNGTPFKENGIEKEIVERLSERMAEYEAQSDVLIDLECPACGNRWHMIFDIVVFLWSKICVYARKLMEEVHILASVYGWRETDILSMSPFRRQCYVEMVT